MNNSISQYVLRTIHQCSSIVCVHYDLFHVPNSLKQQGGFLFYIMRYYKEIMNGGYRVFLVFITLTKYTHQIIIVIDYALVWNSFKLLENSIYWYQFTQNLTICMVLYFKLIPI